jgi:hypothetical protein
VISATSFSQTESIYIGLHSLSDLLATFSVKNSELSMLYIFTVYRAEKKPEICQARIGL